MAQLPDDDWLDGLQPVEVFKHDGRSKVWSVRAPGVGPVVIKRFEHSPLRQRLASWAGIHPAQIERRLNRYLASQGVPVVPIIRQAAQRRLTGVRLWLATPMWGRSLERWLTRGPVVRFATRKRIICRVGRMIARLLDLGLVFRDLKTSNIVANPEGEVWLIDVGGMRSTRKKRRILRMLAMFDRTAARDGATRTDRLRCLRRIVKMHAGLGDLRDVAAAVREQGQRHEQR